MLVLEKRKHVESEYRSVLPRQSFGQSVSNILLSDVSCKNMYQIAVA